MIEENTEKEAPHKNAACLQRIAVQSGYSFFQSVAHGSADGTSSLDKDFWERTYLLISEILRSSALLGLSWLPPRHFVRFLGKLFGRAGGTFFRVQKGRRERGALLFLKASAPKFVSDFPSSPKNVRRRSPESSPEGCKRPKGLKSGTSEPS